MSGPGWFLSSFPIANTMIPLPQVFGEAAPQPLAHFSCPDGVSGISEPDFRCN